MRWWKSHAYAALANASVTIARYIPRTRKDGMPMMTAATVQTVTASASAGTNWRLRWMSAPAIVMAPRPARANWASESWPAHPVRMVTETTTIAMSAMREYRKYLALVSIASGTTTATTSAARAGAQGSRRTR